MCKTQTKVCQAEWLISSFWLRRSRLPITGSTDQKISTSQSDVPTLVWTASQRFPHALPVKCSIRPHRCIFSKTHVTKCVRSDRTQILVFSVLLAINLVPLVLKDLQSVTLASSHLDSHSSLRQVHVSNSVRADSLQIWQLWAAKSAPETAKAAHRLSTVLLVSLTFTISKVNVWKVVQAILSNSTQWRCRSV